MTSIQETPASPPSPIDSESDDVVLAEDVSQSKTANHTTPHPRRWLIFGIVASGMLMGNLDQTVVATALPTLAQSLRVEINWAAWTFTIYQLGMVLALPVAGRLSDQFGRKKVFLFSVVLFSISSLLCGLSTNIVELISFRAVQAVGAGGFMPSATGIVADHFGKDRDRGVGLFSSIAPAGALTGPVLGGSIIHYWSWRGVFLINIPIAIIVFTLGFLFIPNSKPKGASRADFLGIFFLGMVILPMMYGITTLGSGKTSLASPQFLIPEIVAVLFGYLMYRHTNRVPDPILPLKLLKIPAFAAMNVINIIYGGCILGIGALVPLYAEKRYHFSSIDAGSVLTARAVGVIVMSAIAAFVVRRTGYRRPMIIGFGLAAISMVLIGMGESSPTPHPVARGTALVMGVGAGIAIPATNNALLQFSTSNVAAISGIRGMFKQIGAILTISITSAFVARSSHPGVELGHAFIVFAVLVFVIVLPLVFMVPERKGSW